MRSTIAYEDRAGILARARTLKMACSAHAYVRGNTAKFYDWLKASPRSRWCAEFARRPDARLDTPSWLWESVVGLAASHEAGYLEHCRRYAMES